MPDHWLRFGHLIKPGESTPHGITREEALTLFKRDLADHVASVQRLIHIPLTQNQFDALVSLAFNYGEGNLSKTRLLSYMNERRFELARVELLDINRVNGVASRGLTIRRQQEWDMFTNGNYDSTH